MNCLPDRSGSGAIVGCRFRWLVTRRASADDCNIHVARGGVSPDQHRLRFDPYRVRFHAVDPTVTNLCVKESELA